MLISFVSISLIFVVIKFSSSLLTKFKSLWIQRINAGVRSEGLTYSKFISGLTKCGIKLDTKILAEIAYDSPEAFKTIVQKAQSALN